MTSCSTKFEAGPHSTHCLQHLSAKHPPQPAAGVALYYIIYYILHTIYIIIYHIIYDESLSIIWSTASQTPTTTRCMCCIIKHLKYSVVVISAEKRPHFWRNDHCTYTTMLVFTMCLNIIL